MNWNAVWIQPNTTWGYRAGVYETVFPVQNAGQGSASHHSAWRPEAHLNGKRIGNFVLAPGWTSYYSRLQYQSYDITTDLAEQNTITVAVGKGWYRSPMPGWCDSSYQDGLRSWPAGLLAEEITMKTAHLKQLAQTPPGALQKCHPIFRNLRRRQYDASKDFSAALCRAHVLEGLWDSLIPQGSGDSRAGAYFSIRYFHYPCR